jgi:hypothetical protein
LQVAVVLGFSFASSDILSQSPEGLHYFMSDFFTLLSRTSYYFGTGGELASVSIAAAAFLSASEEDLGEAWADPGSYPKKGPKRLLPQ